MQIVIRFTNTEARSLENYLQRRYRSKAQLEKLAKVAIRREAAQEAMKDLDPEFIARKEA